MRKYRFTALVERDEDGLYVGIVPDLKGCHTQARTLAELEKRLKEAVKLCLEIEKRPFKMIGRGLLRSILREIGVERKEYERLRHG